MVVLFVKKNLEKIFIFKEISKFNNIIVYKFINRFKLIKSKLLKFFLFNFLFVKHNYLFLIKTLNNFYIYFYKLIFCVTKIFFIFLNKKFLYFFIELIYNFRFDNNIQYLKQKRFVKFNLLNKINNRFKKIEKKKTFFRKKKKKLHNFNIKIINKKLRTKMQKIHKIKKNKINILNYFSKLLLNNKNYIIFSNIFYFYFQVYYKFIYFYKNFKFIIELLEISKTNFIKKINKFMQKKLKINQDKKKFTLIYNIINKLNKIMQIILIKKKKKLHNKKNYFRLKTKNFIFKLIASTYFLLELGLIICFFIFNTQIKNVYNLINSIKPLKVELTRYVDKK